MAKTAAERSQTAPLSRVVTVDAKKCVNCHACIAACPVKFCNDASGDHVEVNPNLCIGCGECIDACTHGARMGVDDFDTWMEAVGAGTPMVAISAPAIAANFPGSYLRLHGWLKSLGVQAFFDVSFGAELTVRSYLEYMRAAKPATVIAQPCPAIVSYVELYQPELIQYLAPADSPMLHTARMIKEFYPEYRRHRILVLSPCLAKRREFDAVGIGDYNVTYRAFADYLKEHHINLDTFPEVDFSGSAAERAVLFSTPGGLQRTVERESPGAAKATRKIEGPHTIYHYLAKLPGTIESGLAPALVDCLNCEMGCNGGPGTLNRGASPDVVESHIERRNIAARKGSGLTKWRARRTVRKAIDQYWRPQLYGRSYVNRSANNTIARPTNAQFEVLYQRMHKFAKEDFLNCGACGYGACELMAVAIHNGLNHPHNCFHFEKISRTEMTSLLFTKIRQSTARLTSVLNSLTAKDTTPGRLGHGTANAGTPGGDADVVSMQDIAEISRGIRESIAEGLGYIDRTIVTMSAIDTSTEATAAQMAVLTEQIQSIWEIVGMISAIADQTKIIAFNAELEASSAGSTGRNFEIVASEIRRLANSTVDSTAKIKEKIQQIQTSSQLLVTTSHQERRSVAEGTDVAGQLRNTFGRLGDFAGESDTKINSSIATQIAVFQQTLDELSSISHEMDRFGQA